MGKKKKNETEKKAKPQPPQQAKPRKKVFERRSFVRSKGEGSRNRGRGGVGSAGGTHGAEIIRKGKEEKGIGKQRRRSLQVHPGFAVDESFPGDVESSQHSVPVPRIGCVSDSTPSPPALYGPWVVLLIATRSTCAGATLHRSAYQSSPALSILCRRGVETGGA